MVEFKRRPKPKGLGHLATAVWRSAYRLRELFRAVVRFFRTDGVNMARVGTRNTPNEAMTLRTAMQESIGTDLRSGYQLEQEIPYGLLVPLMQMKEGKERARRVKTNPIARRA